MTAKPFPVFKNWKIKKSQNREIERIRATELFDAEYYLDAYPDVAASGMNPLVHYAEYGALEGRKANALFDSAFYLKKYPDVADARINPLVHFALHGWRELRDPDPEFDIVWYWLVHMDGSLEKGNPLQHYLQYAEPNGLAPQPLAPMPAIEIRDIGTAVQGILQRDDLSPNIFFAVGDFLVRRKLWPQAELVYRALASLRWNDADVHERLAAVLDMQGNWWQQADELTTAIELDGSQPDWFRRSGIAQQAMGRWDAAARIYKRYLGSDPSNADVQYRLGYVLEKLRNPEFKECYAKAIALSENKDAQRFGVGVLHQARGYWDEAAKAYAQRLKEEPVIATLHYRLGMAFDRCYRWRDAELSYRTAIALNPDVPEWHYRLGFVLERMQRWREAASAYAAATFVSAEPKKYWKFRAGYVLMQAGEHQAGCEAFLSMYPELPGDAGILETDQISGDATSLHGSPDIFQSRTIPLIQQALATDYTRADWHFALGRQYERVEKWDVAADCYRAAIDRSETHRPSWFYRLGLVLSRAARFEEACLAFVQERILQRPHGVSEAGLARNTDQALTTSYVEYAECLPIRKNVVLYESFNGNSITCNPLAIFRKIAKDPSFADFLHIWVLNDKDRIPEELRTMSNVVFVSRASDAYLRHIATAEYLINNSGFPPYFSRRDGQKYLATWHGTPLKTLGKEQKYKFYDHKRTQRNFLQSTHIISPNEFTTNILLDSYDIRPIYTGKFLESGYPRIDLTINATKAEKDTLRRRLAIPEGKPVVLYAPTWRGTLDDVQFDTQRLEDDLNALGEQGCHVLFRGHSLLETVLAGSDVKCNVVPADIDSNELLSIVDVLITDYSSIFFDFMATGRHILYYIYDLDEYEAERGLYFDMTEMPGYKCRTIEDLCSALEEALSGTAPEPEPEPEHYRSSQGRFNYRDDGLATQRVIDFFFRDSQQGILDFSTSRNARVLMHAGSFAPNGITSSFINLVKNIDRSKVDVVLAFSPTTVEKSAESMWLFSRLPADIYAIPRYGNMPMTLEERWLRIQQEAHPFSLSDEAEAILKTAYQREFTRIFGRWKFDAAVSFGGYDAFWSAIILNNNCKYKKVTYLHNDMYSEFITKTPALERMFRLYRESDHLVSVSETMSNINREKISGRFNIASRIFTYVENMLDLTNIAISANEDIDTDLAHYLGGGKTFLTMGRMSVEKDHAKLLHAFKLVMGQEPDAKLIVLGDGPLRHEIEVLVDSLELNQSVFLAGQRSNPFPALKASDCFVLSSNHEGQPMVLLEAMTLEKPIVATDIAGNRGVLEGRGGLLVENSIDGMAKGMLQFLQGTVSTCKFDAEQYRRQALAQFEHLVLTENQRQKTKAAALVTERQPALD